MAKDKLPFRKPTLASADSSERNALIYFCGTDIASSVDPVFLEIIPYILKTNLDAFISELGIWKGLKHSLNCIYLKAIFLLIGHMIRLWLSDRHNLNPFFITVPVMCSHIFPVEKAWDWYKVLILIISAPKPN